MAERDALPRHGDASVSPDLRTITLTWREYLVVLIFLSLSSVVCLLVFFFPVFWVLLFVVCACSLQAAKDQKTTSS